MSKITTYVVIPNWNGIDVLAACLESLKAQTEAHKTVVVDNGSKDGSIKYIQEKHPEVELIRLGANTGFTGGVNVGIKQAMKLKADFVALFNNDAIADKNWLRYLLRAANSTPSAGIITCKFLRLDRTHIDSTGDFYSIWGLPYPRGRNETDSKQYDDQPSVFGASGGATLYRAIMLNSIGLFDQDFFAYFEDVDISFRAQLAGWKVLYEPDAIAYHHVSATSSKLGDFARYHSTKNFLLVYFKNMPSRLLFKYLPLLFLQYCRMAASSTLKGKILVFFRGSWAAFRLFPSTLTKRKAIQSSMKVSVSYIDNILVHNRPPKPPILKDTRE